jgi:hypothetical protein
MTEIRNVNVRQADEKCPRCQNGYMRPTGVVTQSNPPSYEHRCNARCGHVQNYPMRYPYTIG